MEWALHDAQLEVYDSPARFKVVVAGRRFGKSWLACICLLQEALKNTNEYDDDLSLENVYYVAPTFEQAKRIMWPMLKKMGKLKIEGGVIQQVLEKDCSVILLNGRKISIKGADDPDSLRGVGLNYVVMDEYAFMKPKVWDMILEPALARTRGKALFIGTPEGKNHFYDLYMMAKSYPDKTEWDAFHFKTIDNPTIPKEETSRAKRTKSADVFKQEYEASFDAGGKGILKTEWWKFEYKKDEGEYYIAVDLAGFSNEGTPKKKDLKRLDDHAIVVVKAGTWGWYVEKIISGQWNVRATALEIMNAYRKFRPIKLGIEKGIAQQAVIPYLEDEMKRFNIYFPVHELSHGGNKKEERILWALQGRLEKGRIFVKPEEEEDWGKDGTWQRKLVEQANDFPSSITHDDCIDALAYIDQLADVPYFSTADIIDNWEPLDLVAGF